MLLKQQRAEIQALLTEMLAVLTKVKNKNSLPVVEIRSLFELHILTQSCLS